MSRTCWVAVSIVPMAGVLAAGGVARAETDETGAEIIAARGPANEDSFTPGLTHAAAAGRGIITATTQFTDPLPKDKTTLDLNAEIQLLGPLRLVLRVDQIFGNKAQPGIGAAVQFLSQAHFGVDASAYFSYKSEGFTEAEGELEGLVAFGRQMGAVHGTLNLAYGQDVDNRERDGEVALGLHVEPLPGLFTGVIGRFRDALGSNGDKGTGIVRDALAGLTATYVVGRFGLTGTVGYAGVKQVASALEGGTEAAVALGAVF
ncbi:MAG TPA: hypothetical protein VFP84_17800 [Kofleriaceae bacterium]|nr:hypothetical protein [Kofleriaceae bacterium]